MADGSCVCTEFHGLGCVTPLSTLRGSRPNRKILKLSNALLVTPLPPLPSQMQAAKKSIQEAEARVCRFLRYIIAQVLYFILFSLKTYKYGTIQFILIKCQPV